MPYEINQEGVVKVRLPGSAALVIVAYNPQAASGYEYSLSADDNQADVTLADIQPSIDRAWSRFTSYMNEPGYEPSPLLALAGFFAQDFDGAQIMSIPDFDGNPDDPEIIY